MYTTCNTYLLQEPNVTEQSTAGLCHSTTQHYVWKTREFSHYSVTTGCDCYSSSDTDRHSPSEQTGSEPTRITQQPHRARGAAPPPPQNAQHHTNRQHLWGETNTRGLSPQANYTRQTTACRWSYCQLLRIEWQVVSVTNSYGRILGFLDRSRYFYFQVVPHLYWRGWVDLVTDPLLLKKNLIVPGI
jgi:hypothetical protein